MEGVYRFSKGEKVRVKRNFGLGANKKHTQNMINSEMIEIEEQDQLLTVKHCKVYKKTGAVLVSVKENSWFWNENWLELVEISEESAFDLYVKGQIDESEYEIVQKNEVRRNEKVQEKPKGDDKGRIGRREP